MMNICRIPLLAAAMAVAGAASAGDDASMARKMQLLDTNDDGRVSAAEYVAGDLAEFARVDRDGDGFASRSELQAYWAQHADEHDGGHAQQPMDGRDATAHDADHMHPGHGRVPPTEATHPATTPSTTRQDAASERPVVE